MGRKSKIEAHPDRKIITARLASGEEYSGIVRDFPELTWDDLDYFKRNKLPSMLSKSTELKAEVESFQGNQTLDEVRELKAEARSILSEAREAGDLKTALLGIDKALKCLELIFKAEGIIKEQPQINLLNIYASPQWDQVGLIFSEILAPFPELRRQVAGRLLELAREGR